MNAMTTDTTSPSKTDGAHFFIRAIASAAGLALSAWVSYEVATGILTSAISSRADQMLGGMWSVIATIFVCRESYRKSIASALSRTVATLLSFVLCLAYLLVLPFSPWGMALLIGIGAIVLVLIGRPEDVITSAITTAVVMVVAGISPEHRWMQPILRLIDTLIGVAVGIAAVSILMFLRDKSAFGERTFRTEESQSKIAKEAL